MMQDQETVILQGHIIDSLILAKVLDRILMMGGTFDIQDMQIGKTREEPSRALQNCSARFSMLFSPTGHRSRVTGTAAWRRRRRTGSFPTSSTRPPICLLR
jgi:hypothetical protein